MGSISCKEYKTSSDNESCKNQPDSGIIGSYQLNSETSTASMPSEYTDPVVVCTTSDIKENEMKQLSLDEDNKILLIKQKDQYYAIGNKCTHYGAPLHTGVLTEGRVRCPWHGACFKISNGDIEDFPGLDSLPCYKVEVTPNGEVKVRAKRKDLENNKRLKDMVKRDPTNDCTYVIIGGGPAGGVCAETLRQEGFTGRIVMLCKENALPYDRIKVSKSMDIALEKIEFRNADFYNEHSIETMLGVEATRIDSEKKYVHCSNGYEIKFDKMFIATGVRAVKPSIPGAELVNVFTVRDHADAATIHATFKPEMNVVCLGSSFIALECAAYFAKKAKSVTVIARGDFPLSHSFGDRIGERVLQLYRENNVIMTMNSGITEIIGNSDGKVAEVQLKDGSKIPCDILIMGTGGKANTEFLSTSGVTLTAKGRINTNEYLETNIPCIYAGGDIANSPVFSIGDKHAVVEHYQIAQYHGRIAALNMTEKFEKLRAVPFFFTMVFGKGFRYSGYGSFKDTYIEGDLANLKFAAYFLDENDNVVAVASCGRDPIVAQFQELQSHGKSLKKSDIIDQDDPTAWTRKLLESN